jgi:hypothetical protein
MRSKRWFVLAIALCVALLGGAALAQQGIGWFGAQVVDASEGAVGRLQHDRLRVSSSRSSQAAG